MDNLPNDNPLNINKRVVPNNLSKKFLINPDANYQENQETDQKPRKWAQ